MSRSGYSDDCENVQLWRGAVDRATFGARGQAFMRKLRVALDAMPVKRLITDTFANESGEVCALGAVDPAAKVDPYDRDEVAAHFNIAPALAAEIVYENDEQGQVRYARDADGIWVRLPNETPEERWTRMRRWVEKQIGPDAEPAL
jgi:hypothetical protein